MKLIRPTIKYKTGFLQALDETMASDQKNLHMLRKYITVADIKADFVGFVEKISSFARGENQPEGYVPDSIFWLIDDDTFIGQISIRHKLTKKLKREGGHIGYFIRPSYRQQGYGTAALKLAIQKAKELNIERILVTCDTTNVASKKIIEKNGGVLENIVEIAPDKPKKMRFWITPE